MTVPWPAPLSSRSSRVALPSLLRQLPRGVRGVGVLVARDEERGALAGLGRWPLPSAGPGSRGRREAGPATDDRRVRRSEQDGEVGADRRPCEPDAPWTTSGRAARNVRAALTSSIIRRQSSCVAAGRRRVPTRRARAGRWRARRNQRRQAARREACQSSRVRVCMCSRMTPGPGRAGRYRLPARSDAVFGPERNALAGRKSPTGGVAAERRLAPSAVPSTRRLAATRVAPSGHACDERDDGRAILAPLLHQRDHLAHGEVEADQRRARDDAVADVELDDVRDRRDRAGCSRR